MAARRLALAVRGLGVVSGRPRGARGAASMVFINHRASAAKRRVALCARARRRRCPEAPQNVWGSRCAAANGAEPGQTFWARSRGWSVAPTHPPPRLGPWQPRASVWPPVCPPASRRDVERRVSSCRRRPWWRRRPKTGGMLRRGDSTGSARTRQSPTASAPGLFPGQTRPATCPLSSGRLLNELAVREAGRAGLLGHDGRRGSARPRRLLGALPAPHPWLNRCCGGRQAGPHLSMR